MKRLTFSLVPFVLAAALVPAAAAARVAVANGGGNGTFDGSTAGSHFDFGVIYGNRARGQFQCNMAGDSAHAVGPDQHSLSTGTTVVSRDGSCCAGWPRPDFSGPA